MPPGLNPVNESLEGLSLLPALRGEGAEREAVFSDLDYAIFPARGILGVGVTDASATMVSTARWKDVRFEGFRPQLFDRANDADEFNDLGAAPTRAGVRAEMEEQVCRWRTRCCNRTATTDQGAIDLGIDRTLPGSVRIGEWSSSHRRFGGKVFASIEQPELTPFRGGWRAT